MPTRLVLTPSPAGTKPFQTAPIISPPPAARRLPTSQHVDSSNPNALTARWLLGVHGGAGVSSLVRAGVPGVDADRVWPGSGLVVLVARRTAWGLEWARDAARQHASGHVAPDVALVGLVVIADAPGHAPRRITRFLDLVASAFSRVWEVPWVEEWRLASHDEPLPIPPAVRQLNKDMQALTGVSTARDKE